ncbi:MAG: class I SAM-dependent methyltransferase [Myxococcota bacterium]
MSDPYAAIAAFYDAEFEGAGADVAYFARHGVAGPLLVLGCGTGRVCRGLAPRAITGLDRSAAMLARGRGDWRRVEGDMRAFDLGAFAEVLVPNAAFCFLDTRADQLACLRACRRALAAGAPLTLDLPMPDPALLAVPHTPEKPAWEGLVDGRPARRTREVHRSAVEQRLRLVDRYVLDGAVVATSELRLRLLWPREVEWLCEAAGFYVDALHGDYAGGPIRDGCDRLIVRAIALA